METIFEKVINKYDCIIYKNYCSIPILQTEENLDKKFELSCLGYRKPWEQDEILTDSEENYVKNYANVFASISHRRDTVVICKDDKKITLKKFTYHRGRNRGAKFLRKQTGVYYISYNFEKNNLYYGFINNYHLKRKSTKSIKQDSFGSQLFSNFYSKLRVDFQNCLDKEFNTNGMVDDVIDIFLGQIIKSNEYNNLPRIPRLKKFILDKKGYKLPNNWESFLECHSQPSMKEIKKHDMKYIDSFMAKNQINGDKIKKVLHLSNRIDVNNINCVFSIFGKDFILGKDYNELIKITSSVISLNVIDYHLYKKFINQSVECRNKLYNLILLSMDNIINLWTLSDHIRMYFNLSKFEPTKWSANCLESFNQEHIDYSENLQKYTIGDRHRIYSNRFIEQLEKPILFEGKTYIPCVLKDFSEYANESLIQSNCVRSYIDREDSLIVSLREDSKNGKERASIEYKIFCNEKNNNINLKRVQTLGKFNEVLGENWNEPIQDLDTRIIFISKFFELPKLRIVTNFKEYIIDSEFVEVGLNKKLMWGHTEETKDIFRIGNQLTIL
jgi:hypothetical protein